MPRLIWMEVMKQNQAPLKTEEETIKSSSILTEETKTRINLNEENKLIDSFDELHEIEMKMKSND